MTTTPIQSVTCYENRDNSFLLTLKINGTTLTEEQMQSLTKFEIQYMGVYYDSETYPDAFERDDVNGEVTIRPYELGLLTGSDKVEFIVYDNDNYSHGLLWEQIKLKIKNDAV